MKHGDDETTVDLFRRIREDVQGAEADQRKFAVRQQGFPAVKDGMILVTKLVEWLEERVGRGFGLPDQVVAAGLVVDEVLHELVLAEWQKGGGNVEDRGAIRDDLDRPDEEDDALRMAERLVYGWPNRNEEPTGVRCQGRFARSFPLEFPMGVADLFEERPRKVSPEAWVQHLLRYETGQFVGGARGQRVLWAMVNTLLLSEARARGFGVYRNVMRRVGFGLQGGRVLATRYFAGGKSHACPGEPVVDGGSRRPLDNDAVGVRGQEA